MASAFVSSISLPNGSVITSASSRPPTSLPSCLNTLPSRLPHSLFLSFPLSRSYFSSHRPPKCLISFVRAEFPTEELDTLDAPVDLNDDPEAAKEVPDFGASNNPPEGTKLYVGNLPWTCNSQELADVFQKIGSVEMVEVIYDRESGRSRGFGFVTMSSMEDANVAVEKLDGSDYGGRAIRVNFPNRGRGDPPPRRFDDGRRYDDGPGPSSNTTKLFVGNLPWGIDDVTLEQIFSEHGKVLEAKVVYDRESGRSRGFGFVTLSSALEVNEAINNMDGAEVEGRSLRVNLASDRPAPRQNFF